MKRGRLAVQLSAENRPRQDSLIFRHYRLMFFLNHRVTDKIEYESFSRSFN